MSHDKVKGAGTFTIHRFSDRAAYLRNDYYSKSSGIKNVLLNEGIGALLNLLIGATATNYSTSNAYMGVGASTASSGVATSTGLLSTNRLYIAVSSVTISSQTVTWRSVYSSLQANYNWREFTVKNGSTASTSNAGTNLNRAVSNQGTKASGQTWTLDLSITFS